MANILQSKEDLNQFIRVELLPAFETAVTSEFDGFLKAVFLRMEEAQKQATEGNTEEVVRLLKAFPEILNVPETAYFIKTTERLVEACIPELIVAQQEEHYQSLAGDSVYTKTVKRAKKSARAIAKVMHKLRFIGKEEKPALAYRNRIIPFKNLVKTLFLRRVKIWDQFNATRQSFVYNCIHQAELGLINKLLPDSDGGAPLALIFEQNKLAIADLHNSLVASLKKELGEAISEWERVSDKVGTFELPASKYDDRTVQRLSGIVQQTSNQINTTWAPLIQEVTNQLGVIYELLELKQRIAGSAETLSQSYSGFLEQNLVQPHQQVRKEFDKWLEQLSKVNKEDADTAFSVSKRNKKKVYDQLSKSIIEPIQQRIEQESFSLQLNQFTAQISGMADRHKERIKLIKLEHIVDGVPEYEFKEINWQTFLRRLLGDLIASGMVPDLIKPERELQELVDAYTQLLQVVETNLDVATEVEDKEDPESQEVLAKGIQLSITKMDDIQGEIEALQKIISEPLEASQKAFCQRLFELMTNQDVGEMKWADTQLKVKESAGNYGQRLSVVWARLLDRLGLGWRFVRQKAGQLNQSARGFLGYSEKEHINVKKTNIAKLLHDTEQTYKELPFIYNRLFSFKREVEHTFFIKNQSCFQSVEGAMNLWKTDFPASVSIIGEKGSGKTTFIKHLGETLFQEEQMEVINFTKTVGTEQELVKFLGTQFRVDKAESVRDIINKINRRRKRSIIVVENIQNCFVRHINGYEAINALLYLISETRQNVLWVVSCSRYAWNFLDVVLKVSEYFSHSVPVDNYTEDEIKQLILRRQQASGYKVLYQPDASTVKSRSYRKTLANPEEEQKYLEEKLFEQLWKHSEGNSTAALIYWVRSIVSFEESHFVIEPQKLSGIEYLQELDSNSLFILAAFVLHDTLHANELAMVMRISEMSAQMQISRLQAQGLLVNKKGNYSLNDMVFRQVVRLLKSRNILNT